MRNEVTARFTSASTTLIGLLVRWVRILPILALTAPSSATSAAELVLAGGELEWVGEDVDGRLKPVAGGLLPDSGAIASTGGVTVLQSGVDLMILLDQGAEAEWRPGRSSLVVRPQAGLVVIQANRTTVDSTGVTVVFGGRRFWIASGTAVFEVGEDGLLISALMRGQQFDLDPDDMPMGEVSSPAVTLEAGGVAVVFGSVSELVRNDQVRIYGTAVRATEMLTEQLRVERPGMRSADLGAVLESLRQLRFHLSNEKRLEINTVLVAAAQREWSLQRSQPFTWPLILPIPDLVSAWDEALISK